MKEALILMVLIGVTVIVTTGHQTEEGTGESVEAAVGAGEAGGREEADRSLPAESGAGVCVRRAAPTPLSQSLSLSRKCPCSGISEAKKDTTCSK